jgi:predicted HAD superfamily Cof-like phosphohydrolase
MRELQNTLEWFKKAGQLKEPGQVNPERAAFYIGMQLEELAEKIEAVYGGSTLLSEEMQSHGRAFKEGRLDDVVSDRLNQPGSAEALLDADMDLIWVSVGAAACQGADVLGAYNEVGRANWDKFPEGVITVDSVSRKIMKPAGWVGPDLKPFTHKGLV